MNAWVSLEDHNRVLDALNRSIDKAERLSAELKAFKQQATDAEQTAHAKAVVLIKELERSAGGLLKPYFVDGIMELAKSVRPVNSEPKKGHGNR